MPAAYVTCRLKDIRRIRQACRCGTVFIAEVPEVIAEALNIKACPGCKQVYGFWREAGVWHNRRMGARMDECAVATSEDSDRVQ